MNQWAANADLRSNEVCKHALCLLAHRGSALRSGELHLDLGCTLGPLAEKVESCLGRIYVGVGGSRDGLTSLGMRGFETHEISLEGEVSILARLREVVGDRRIGSITVLDTIEQVDNCDQLLRDIAGLSRAHSAFVVVSAPNITHRDIGAKLAFGRWDYTPSGIPGSTSARLFDQKLFALMLEKTGLQTIERNDIVQSKSDQHFPTDHPALASGTPLHGLLVSSAESVNPNSRVSKFIWACAPALEVDRNLFGVPHEGISRPFLTAVIRTQGRRNHTLVEVLNCLAAQSDSDFEIVVVGHRLEPSEAEAVQRVILDFGEWFRSRIRLLQVDDGGRSKPLNVGFENARGRYISIVDDDDIPMGNWVEEFRKLDANNRGRILRCASVRQDVVNVQTNGKPGLRASGPPERPYPSEFHLLEHLLGNRSPPIGLAFPRGAFHDLGIRFDESLNTTEDWDYILRVSALCGVASSPIITSVYRWWVAGESSRTDHSQIEWQQNVEAILRKQDQQYYILQKGELARLRQMVAEVNTLRWNAEQHAQERQRNAEQHARERQWNAEQHAHERQWNAEQHAQEMQRIAEQHAQERQWNAEQHAQEIQRDAEQHAQEIQRNAERHAREIQQNTERYARELAGLQRIDYDRRLPPELTGLRQWLSNRSKRRRRFVQDYHKIAASPLFDRDWYLQKNPDVAAAKVNAALHYLQSGGREGRAPGPYFQANAYLKANPDAAAAGANPLLHFLAACRTLRASDR